MNNNASLIYQAFGTRTYVQGQVDVQHTPIYDTVILAAATVITSANTAFFANVGPANKTLGQCNLLQANRLPAPQAFSILGIRYRWSENILAADAYAVCNALALNFKIGEKSYNLAPLWHYNAGGGLNGFAATTATTTTIAAISNGVTSREAMHKLGIPLVIENQANFFANLEGTATLTAGGSGGTGLTSQLLLDGLYVRGVQ